MPGPVIQWFPGHMAQTRRLMRECLPQVDLVFELLDARVPKSSRNPEIRALLEGKPSLVLLNKADLADPQSSARFLEKLRQKGENAVLFDSKLGKGAAKITEEAERIMAEKLARNRERGISKPLRAMVVGIPNVGKSTLINCLAGEKKAKAENRPGVTVQKQWVRAGKRLELLDMPGVLWPKFDDETIALHLAATGAIKDSILQTEEIAFSLCRILIRRYPETLAARYSLSSEQISGDPYEAYLAIGKRRGLLQSGGSVNEERLAALLLDEFRSGAIGRITLDEG